jgi:hypothetical protein
LTDVSIAILAWTIYNDQRTPYPRPATRDHRTPGPRHPPRCPCPGTERITEIIATEITRHAGPPR